MRTHGRLVYQRDEMVGKIDGFFLLETESTSTSFSSFIHSFVCLAKRDVRWVKTNHFKSIEQPLFAIKWSDSRPSVATLSFVNSVSPQKFGSRDSV